MMTLILVPDLVIVLTNEIRDRLFKVKPFIRQDQLSF